MIIALAVGIVVMALLINRKAVAPVVQVPSTEVPEVTEPVVLCYEYSKKMPSGYTDREVLKMTFSGQGGEQVTGEYRYLPAEKDSKTGTLTGMAGPMDPKISARTADVWWDVMAEGMRATEQLRIVFGEGSAVALFGEMADGEDGNYVYKDVTTLTPGFQMSQVDCASIR